MTAGHPTFMERLWRSRPDRRPQRSRGYHGVVSKKVLLAWPRGYCAGVDRAVETVERLLAAEGPPIYVRKQIVHNLHVVRDLERKGAVFVDRKSTRLNSSHSQISYAVFCLKKKKRCA